MVYSDSSPRGKKIILIAVIVGGSVTILLLGPLLTEDFPINVYEIPDKLFTDENTTYNELLIQYQQLVDQLFDPNFANLSEAEQKSIVNQLQALEMELQEQVLLLPPVDPNQPLPDVPDVPPKNMLEDDPNMFEPPSQCSVGFSFDPVSESCFPEFFDPIINPPPEGTNFFTLSSDVTLEDSNGQRVEDTRFFTIPFSLLGTQGQILDLAKVEIDLRGVTDGNQTYEINGDLEIILNNNVIDQKVISGSQVPDADGSVNPLIDGQDIFIQNFNTITGITSGINTLSFNVTNFKATTGETVFTSLKDLEIYSVDFDNNLARNTVTDSSGKVVAVPIADGRIKVCAESIGLKISGVEYIYIPDVPVSIHVQLVDGTILVPAFQNPAPLPVLGAGNYVVPTSCTDKTGIPRDTPVQVVVSCCTFGTGSENKVSTTTIAVTTTPQSFIELTLDSFVSGRDDLKHYWFSNFGISYTRNTPS